METQQSLCVIAHQFHHCMFPVDTRTVFLLDRQSQAHRENTFLGTTDIRSKSSNSLNHLQLTTCEHKPKVQRRLKDH